MYSVSRDLVSAIADDQPTGPDHLQPGLQRANRLIAAGVIEPVIAHDKVSVMLSLPQRSVHSGGWLFHHRLNAGAMPSRQWPVARTGQMPIFAPLRYCNGRAWRNVTLAHWAKV